MDLYVYYIFVILCKDLYGINAVQWFLFVLSRAVHVLGAYLLYFHIVLVFYVFVQGLQDLYTGGVANMYCFFKKGLKLYVFLIVLVTMLLNLVWGLHNLAWFPKHLYNVKQFFELLDIIRVCLMIF